MLKHSQSFEDLVYEQGQNHRSSRGRLPIVKRDKEETTYPEVTVFVDKDITGFL